MNRQLKIRYLQNVRLTTLPILVGLLAWSAWAMLGKPYVINVNMNGAKGEKETGIQYGTLQPLDTYLAPMNQREMFKQSVIYETKKDETVDILGEFVFLGVVKDNGDVRAFIMNNKTGQSSFYSKGQNLGDLEIQNIQEKKIILHHGSETLELKR